MTALFNRLIQKASFFGWRRLLPTRNQTQTYSACVSRRGKFGLRYNKNWMPNVGTVGLSLSISCEEPLL